MTALDQRVASSPIAAPRTPRAATALAVVLGLAAGLPALLQAFQAVRWGIDPVGDNAVIAVRSFDVLSGRSPLVGQASTVGMGRSDLARSPGPMLYWLHALPARWGPLSASFVLAALVTSACFAGACVLAARRGGLALSFATAVALCCTTRAVDPWFLATSWNPGAGLAPLILLAFVAWSLAVGDHRLFPLAVVLASFLVQAHLTYALPALGLLGIGTAGAFVPVVRARWAAGSEDRSPAVDGRPGRWFGAGVAAGLTCWLLPLWQQLTTTPGNLTVLQRSGGELGETRGLGFGVRRIIHALGISPQFLEAKPKALVLLDPGWPDALTLVSAVLVVVLAVVLAVLAARRRDRVSLAGLATALVLVGSGVAVASKVPLDIRGLTSVYTLLWVAPAGAFVWLSVAVALVREAQARRVLGPAVARWTVSGRTGPALAGVAVAFVVALGIALPHGDFADGDRWAYRPARAVGGVAAAEVVPGGRYLVIGPFGSMFGPAVAYRVRRAGGSPVLAGADGAALGKDYEPSGRRCTAVLRLDGASRRPLAPLRPGAVQLALVRVPLAVAPQPSVLRLSSGPDRGRPSC